MQLIDRTSATADITHSRQISRQTGNPIPIFDPDGASRRLNQVDTIVFHQTDFRTDARGNRVEAYNYTLAHFVVLPNGVVLQLRPFTARLNSVRAINALHVEVVGDFPDDQGRRGSELPLPEQIRASRNLILNLRSHDAIRGQLQYIIAHGQLTGPATGHYNCPGPHVWYNVGLWAVKQLGMIDMVRGARAIPDGWKDSGLRIAS